MLVSKSKFFFAIVFSVLLGFSHVNASYNGNSAIATNGKYHDSYMDNRYGRSAKDEISEIYDSNPHIIFRPVDRTIVHKKTILSIFNGNYNITNDGNDGNDVRVVKIIVENHNWTPQISLPTDGVIGGDVVILERTSNWDTIVSINDELSFELPKNERMHFIYRNFESQGFGKKWILINFAGIEYSPRDGINISQDTVQSLWAISEKCVTIISEDFNWSPNVYIPDDITTGACITIIRKSNWDTNFYFGNNLVKLDKNRGSIYVKSNDGWNVYNNNSNVNLDTLGYEIVEAGIYLPQAFH